MVDITLSLVKMLILEQFPKWSGLSIKPVESGGHDNRTFCLGNDMLIRLPSAEAYAGKVLEEQYWLPKIASGISLPIPTPIVMGTPSKDYPWNWSIYQWIEGESANNISIDEKNLPPIALQLAQFLNELQKIDISNNPLMAGAHNFWRGAHPSIYDFDTRSYIAELKKIIDADSAMKVWDRAIGSKWGGNPVWVHGDLASGNILIKDGHISGIIDFGCMGVGDPACDLVIAWTLLKNESRVLFKRHIALDSDVWARARGWALWKACFTIIKDKSGSGASKQMQIIADIINEHNLEN